MFQWESEYSGSKNLLIQNPETFDLERFEALIQDFEASHAKAPSLAARLRMWANHYQDQGLLWEVYARLLRWCTSTNRVYQNGQFPAQKIWTYLFGRPLPDYYNWHGSGYTTDEAGWGRWHETVST